MDISESDEFKREFKKLLKKYQTLESDFEIAKRAIAVEPRGDGTKHWNTIWKDDGQCIMKVRMMCRAVKRATFRLVYLYDGQKAEILFVEIYFKGNKEREDRERVQQYIDEITKRKRW